MGPERIRTAVLLLAWLMPAFAGAEDTGGGDIAIIAPFSRAAPAVSVAGAAYLTVVNRGAKPDRLLGASSEVAERVELHEHSMDGGVMRMREVPVVPLAPGERVMFEPGGLHVMLLGLRRELSAGGRFELALRFERAGTLVVTVPVLPPGASPAND